MRKIALVSLFFLFALVAFALPVKAEFDVSYNIVEDTIYPDEIAEFSVTLTNYEDFEESFTVFTIDPNWILDVQPAGVSADSGQSASFTLKIQPRQGLPTGPYLVPVRFKSLNKPTTEELAFFVYLKSYTPLVGEYKTSVALGVRVPEKLDPRNKLALEVELRNRNGLDIKELNVRVTSDIFSKDYTTSLGPLEEKSSEILFDVDLLEKPGIYPVTVEIFRNNESVSKVEKNIEIVDYSKIEEESYFVRELFKKTEYITVKNIGNEKKTATIDREKNFFERIFTKTDPSRSPQKIDGKNVYSWTIVGLDPLEEYQVTVVENYRFLASIIIIIILIVVGYYLFRSPIITLKRAKLLASKEEDASFIKIKIFMRNRTKKPVYNIKVLDRVPKMANVVEDYDVLGTLQPTKVVRNPRLGSIVRWDIEKLDPYEERIISYKIKSHLKIVGSIKLAPLKARFDTGLGRERSTFSNSVNIDTEIIRQSNDLRDDSKRFRRRA